MDHDQYDAARSGGPAGNGPDPRPPGPRTPAPAVSRRGSTERPRRRSRLVRGTAAFAVAAAAGVNGGCEMPRMLEAPRIPGVYRIDVQQGNAVDREMLDQLEIGMDTRKVRFIMGTPLLVDPFHQNRWDYVYSLRTGSGPAVRQRATLYFVDDRLARIEDHLDPDVVPEMASERIRTLVTVPQRRTRTGFLDMLVPDFLKPDRERTPTANSSTPLPEVDTVKDTDSEPSGTDAGTTSSE